MIEVRELTKSFGSTLAVDHVSFDVARGEVLGFLGPNGAGKTTTMRILTGFLPADSGGASVAGFEIHDQSLEVRKRIGYLPENSPLYHEMGVVEYLDYVATVRGIEASERPARIQRMIEVCGLGAVLKKDIRELSKGYRQRVGLAATLIHDPGILILDEPTSGLDPNQIIEIRSLIKNIGREKTIILSTHILPEVEATCGRVIIISQGRIVASGTPEELSATARGQASYHVTARGPAEGLVARLGAIDGVSQVRVQSETGGLVRLRIEASGDAELGEAIFSAVAAAGWTLGELRHDAATLEQVFTRLTTGEA